MLERFFKPSPEPSIKTKITSEEKTKKKVFKFKQTIIINMLKFIPKEEIKHLTLINSNWKKSIDSCKQKLSISKKVLPFKIKNLLNRFVNISELEFKYGTSFKIDDICFKPFNCLTSIDVIWSNLSSSKEILKLLDRAPKVDCVKVSSKVLSSNLLDSLIRHDKRNDKFLKQFVVKEISKSSQLDVINNDLWKIFFSNSPNLEHLQLSSVSSSVFSNLNLETFSQLKSLSINNLKILNNADWLSFIHFANLKFPCLQSLKISRIIKSGHILNEEFEDKLITFISSHKPMLLSYSFGNFFNESLLRKLRRVLIHQKKKNLMNLKLKGESISDEVLEDFFTDINITKKLDLSGLTRLNGYCFEKLKHGPISIRVKLDEYKIKCLQNTLISLNFKKTIIIKANK
jgi:hypothetical protein